MPLSAEDQYFGETNQSTSNVEDEYFGETKSAEDEYFGPETAGSQKYSKEQEKQLTESIYLEEALNEARRGMVPVKNASKTSFTCVPSRFFQKPPRIWW